MPLSRLITAFSISQIHTSRRLYYHLLLEILMSFELIKQCIRQLPNLTYLVIRATGAFDLLNGQLWEEYFLETKVKEFYFKFTLGNSSICQDDKKSLLQSFRSSFWLEKKHWYVACEKGQSQTSRPTIYSIPYFQSSVLLYPSNHFPPISTAEKDIISKHTTNLILTFHKTTLILPTSPFTHVYSLTLLTSILPSIKILQSIVNLNRIQKLDVSSIKNVSIDEFQILIDHMINLKHIKMQYNPFFSPPLRIDSYTLVPKDEQISVIDINNITRFCHLFFHISYLEITVQTKDIIIQLINQLHYLESVKIFCYQDYLIDIKQNWFQENILRFNKINFAYRMTSCCLFLSIGDRKVSLSISFGRSFDDI